MARTFNIINQVIIRLFLLSVTLFTFFSCSQNKSARAGNSVKIITHKPPVIIAAKAPIVIQLDTCPPPRKVIIPTKPGGFDLRKSDIGLKRIQSVPPEKKAAGFFAPMQNFNTEDGLAMGVVYGICEDKNGNLWFGTAGAGVSRYDGKSFTTFTIAQGLVNNWIYSVYVDKSGKTWFISIEGGVSCWDGKAFTNYTKSQGLASNSVLSVIEDRDGYFWFGTIKGLSRFDSRSKSFITFTTANGLANDFVSTLFEDSQGNIWIGCSGGVSRLDQRTKLISQFSSMAGKYIQDILEDKNGNLFFGCYEGLYHVLREERSTHGDSAGVTEYTISKGLVSSIILNMIEDKKGKIWLATRGGLSQFDPNSSSFKTGAANFTNYKKEQGLPSNYLLNIYEDHLGNIWLTSNGGGVSRLDQGGRVITTYAITQGLAEDHILNIMEDKDKDMWFGTEGGISRLDHEGKYFKNLTTAQGLVDYWVYSIIEDKNNDIWFCTQGDGLSRVENDWKSITTYSTAQGLVSNLIFCLYEDKNGNIWLGSDAGIGCFDGKTFTNYTQQQGLINNFVREIIADQKGNLWVATDSGISRLNLSGKSVSGDKVDITNFTAAQGLAHNSVRCILEDDSGNLWFGTFGGGCSRFDGKTFLNITTADGLADDNVYDIVKDDRGIIWVGTNKGLTALKGFSSEGNPESNSMKKRLIQKAGNLSNDAIKNGGYKPVFEIYNSLTGYPIKDIYGRSMYMSTNNILWAGTGENLVRFDYNAVYKSTEPPRIFIQNLKVNNEKISWNSLLSALPGKKDTSVFNCRVSPDITEEAVLFGRPLNEDQRDTLGNKFGDIKFDSISSFYPVPVNPVLPYRHNNLTFDFAAIEPSRPNLVNYQYMLVGYDNGWSPAGNEKSASFGNIHEGNYTFKLKAQSPDGVWSEPLVYTFRVLPPFYRTWWAYGLYLALFVAVLSKFIKRRLSVLKKQKVFLEEKLKMQNALMNERSRISRELHDEVGATLSGIAMYSHLTKEQLKNAQPNEVEKSLNTMQQSAGEMVNKLNDIVWLISPSQDSLQKMIQRIEEYATDMSTIKSMQVKVNIPLNLAELSLPVESRRNIYLFCKEAINNSVKYSSGTLLEVSIREINNKLTFSVSDNGRGFDSDLVKRGNGLDNMQKRAQEIGAKFTLHSKPGEGCVISIQLKSY